MNGLKLGSIMLASLGFLLLNSPVSAQNNLRAELESFQEVPAVSSPASGQFRGRVIKNTIEYTLSYKGLEEDVTVTQSHIHFGQPGVNGGIVVFLCQVKDKSVDPTGLAPQCPLTDGSVSGTLTSANLTTTAQEQGIGATPPDFAKFLRAIREDVTYVNVHTTKFGGGEIRGQIK